MSPASPPRPLLAGLPPVADPRAEVLILGTLPGPLSLERRQYYAHPRNAFWPVIGALLGFDAALSYRERLAALRDARLALWDVLAACSREGAADSSIRDARANDFASFFAAHPRLRAVAFNGQGAARLFARHVDPAAVPDAIARLALPSTSPAYAVLDLAAKTAAWQPLADVLGSAPFSDGLPSSCLPLRPASRRRR